MVKQALYQSLQQKLSPQQIQLMKLIELSTLELEQKVKDELETNPALDDENISSENIEDNLDEFEPEQTTERSEAEKEFDIDQYISDDEIPRYKMYANNMSDDDSNEKAPLVGGHTHLDLLQNQLAEIKLAEKELQIGEYMN